MHVLELLLLCMYVEEELAIWLIATRGIEHTIKVANVAHSIPDSLTTEQKITTLSTKTGVGKEDSLMKVILSRTDVLAAIANFSDASPILGPPTGQCIRCKKSLTSSHSTNIRIYSMQGLSEGIKHTLRCKSCSLQYRYSQFGSSKEGFMYYEEPRNLVEVSDTVYFSRRLLELQCSFA